MDKQRLEIKALAAVRDARHYGPGKDAQQSRLYVSERVLDSVDQQRWEVGDVGSVQAYVNRVSAFKRIRELAGWRKPPRLTVRAKQGSTAHACYLSQEIALPCYRGSQWAWSERVVLHELAHHVCFARFKYADPGHGRYFRWVFLQMVQRVMGVEAARVLRESFKAKKLRYKLPRKMSPEARAAAVARLAKYRYQPQGAGQ